jgi:hypothetical protein
VTINLTKKEARELDRVLRTGIGAYQTAIRHLSDGTYKNDDAAALVVKHHKRVTTLEALRAKLATPAKSLASENVSPIVTASGVKT